jgi:L-threonylcarbamoyladenylate synthase
VVTFDEEGLARALEALRDGLVVAIPTDTVYGLAADPFQTQAIDRVFAAKRRPRDITLPVLVASADQALAVMQDPPPGVRALMDAFWPGALTLVVPRTDDLAVDLGTEQETVGVRCPDHDRVRALCARTGPLAVTSANLHNEPTPPTAAEVAALFSDGAVALVLDGGVCDGAASTVIDCTGEAPRLLREGAIPWEDLLRVAAIPK